MDLVSAMLDGLRARDPFVLSCSMGEPWAVRIADRAAIALIVVQDGELWLAPQAGEPVRLGPGDAAVIQRAEPYLIADDPDTSADMVVEPGQVCRPLSQRGANWPPPTDRSWTNGADVPGCQFLVAVYELPGQVTGRLLADLPTLLTVAAAVGQRPAVELLAAEARRSGPGHELMLTRLADLVLVDTLRAWLASAGPNAPSWHRAGAHPVTGVVLRLIHDHPAEQWTLRSLAERANVSRATLARRFAIDVGTPPLTYLTEWRLDRAADLLRASTRTVEAVAHEVGYTNPFAFSTAFKRRFGHSPRAHRSEAQPPASMMNFG